MKKALLIQPGAVGDIFLCAPIARYYHREGYDVIWPVSERFLPILKRFNYVKPLKLSNDVFHQDWLKSDVMQIFQFCDVNNYDLVLNLADRGPHPTAQLPSEKFEETKYRLAMVPFIAKHTLVWERDFAKEKQLYELLVDDIDKKTEYVVAHLESSRGDRTNIPDNEKRKVIEIKPIDGYDIFDWYLVIRRASAIYCVESAVHQFIDGDIYNYDMIPKFLLKRSTVSAEEKSYTVSKNWSMEYY